MTKLSRCLLLAYGLACCVSQPTAAATRIAPSHAESELSSSRSTSSLLGGGEREWKYEGIPNSLRHASPTEISRILIAAAAVPGGPIRLAAAGGGVGPIAVLYPDIGEPYRSVFAKIIEGIEEKAQNKVSSYAVGSSFNPQTVSGELKRQEVKVVIALGRNGLKAASTLDKEIGIVTGGVLSVPEGEGRNGAVLSLAPDPALLLSKLKALAPQIQRVFVAYDPRQNAWLIKLAKEAARNQGIELVAQEAGDLKSAVGIYQNFFSNADPKRDALWLPQDGTTVDEAVVLPLVLQESWSKSFTVFSSNVSHVRRGVLFALYPNNLELGRNLASSALGVVNGATANRGTQPLRNVLTAFNTRTASHLGLSKAAMQQSFDLVFPEQ